MNISPPKGEYTDHIDDAMTGVYPMRKNQKKNFDRPHKNGHQTESLYIKNKYKKSKKANDDYEPFWQNA